MFPRKLQHIKIIIEFYRREPRVIEGKYNKYGLPTDWPDFIESLYDFITFYGFGEMFDKTVYAKTYPKDSDIIFLSVRFGEYGKTYYYITEDDSIEVGDQVIVPVGSNGTERIVDVVKKEYFASSDVPMPIEKVKVIIGKFNAPQKDESGKRMIFCPMFERDIDADDCYDILYDPSFTDFEGTYLLNGKDAVELNEDLREICKKCRYHDE